MRRSVLVLTLIAVCALVAQPASAQNQQHDWFASAGLGPSIGTLGSTPVIDVSAGYAMSRHLSVAGEFGALPHAPFDKAGALAPSVAPLAASSDAHVNAYHANANLFVQPSPLGRLSPYVTAGFGAFTGSTVAKASVDGSRLVQYDRKTNPAGNMGVGATYRVTNWLGVDADYRHFIVNATKTEHVNRLRTGLSLFIR